MGSGSYGIDRPVDPAVSAELAVWLLVCGRVTMLAAGWFAVLPFALAAGLFVHAGWFLHTTRRGKFRAWQRILDELPLRGDEHVLDAGCGRGAVLIAAAQRVPRGKVVGVDDWRKVEQTGNSLEAATRNVETEGVSDRVELVTADLRALPGPPAQFDLVLSALALHGIGSAEGRERARNELVRVLKPGGTLVLADIRRGREHACALTAAGMRDVRSAPGGASYAYGLFAPTTVITATAPD